MRQPPLAEVGEHRAGRHLRAVGGARQTDPRRLQRDDDRRQMIGGDKRSRRRTGEVALDPDAEKRGADRRQAGRQCDEARGVLRGPIVRDEERDDKGKAAQTRRGEQGVPQVWRRWSRWLIAALAR